MYKRIELLVAVIASYCVAMQFLKSSRPAPLKRVHLKDQIMDKMKGGRNAKKRT